MPRYTPGQAPGPSIEVHQLNQLSPEALPLIMQEWHTFEQLAADSSVMAFCDHELDQVMPDPAEHQGRRDLSFLRPDTRSRQWQPHSAARMLEYSYQRLDEFVTTLLETHCARKNMPVPAADDTEAANAIFNRIFSGGVTMLTRDLERSGNKYEDQRTHLATHLILMASHISSAEHFAITDDQEIMPASSQEEADAATDATLQQVCQRIVNDERLTVSKSAGDGDKLFTNAMRCLSTLYHQGKDISLHHQSLVLLSFLDPKPLNEATEAPNPGTAMDAARTVMFEQLNDTFEVCTGTRIPHPGDHRLRGWFSKVLKLMEAGGEADIEAFSTTCRRLQQTRTTRHLVQAVAEGRIRPSRILKAMDQLHTHPLDGLDQEVEVPPSVDLDWEVLPWELIGDEGAEMPPIPDLDVQKPINPDTLDWERISHLKQYALDGRGYIARAVATTENQTLSPDKQYYVAVLPQADGREDALADHPRSGNRLYAWRSETARLRHIVGRNQALTWRDVFCHPKTIAHKLGARRFNHTGNFAFNVLDYMTCPPEKLVAIRYAVGRGVMRMIRLAQGQETPAD